MKTIFSLILLSCLSAPAQQPGAPPQMPGNTTQWETYTYPGEEFAVLLPEMPTVHQMWRSIKNNDRENERARVFGAYGDGIVYLIYSYDKPRHDETIEYFASYFRTYGLNRSAEMYSVGDVARVSFNGRKYAVKLSTSDDAPPARVYICLTKKHAYVLEIVGAADDHPAVQKFLTSFTLPDKPAGLTIKDDRVEAVASAPTPSTEQHGLDKTGVNGMAGQPAFSMKEVERKAYIVSKPTPDYTNAARDSHVTGEVMVRMVLTTDGHVTNITPIKHLGKGLTEQAILAARHVKFIPAMKDGHLVSQYVIVSYNFNIY